MGCHTWGFRLMTDEEFNTMRDRAPACAYDLYGDTEWNKEHNLVDLKTYEQVMESIKTDKSCIDIGESKKYTWYELEFGSWIPGTSDIEPLVEYRNGHMYIQAPLRDVCRVKTYPNKIIWNFKQFKRYLRKRFYQFPEWEREEIRKFFHDYPGGYIQWA